MFGAGLEGVAPDRVELDREEAVDVEVDRRNLHRSRIVQHQTRSLEPGEVRLAIDRFALTSNNVSYAAFGDMLQYWEFFPPAANEPGDTTEWGRAPVWGFADVVESAHGEVAVGRRLYGYLPMGDELVIEAGKVDDRGVIDVAPHRRAMATAYNRYAFTDTDPAYDAGREFHRMVLFPLFFTSWLIDDFLADQGLSNDAIVIVSSASSKTSIGVAKLCADHAGVRVIGLTSTGNVEFCRGLGCYDDVITYDDLASLPGGEAVFVDMAGNADVRAAVHGHYGDALRHSMIVGGTHWDHQPSGDSSALAGPAPKFFFAPEQIVKRTNDWGAETVDERLGAAWKLYAEWADVWVRFQTRTGPTEVEAAFAALVDGDVDPTVGLVCSIKESS